MIDLHSHILPGLDDGPRDLQGSIELAIELAQHGTTVVAATPHVRDDFPTTPTAMLGALALVREALNSERVDIDVVPGAEVAFDWLHRLEPDTLRSFALAGSNYILVELPFYGWPLDVEDQMHRLRVAGLTAVLSHPERNSAVQDSVGRIASLVEQGALVQITAGSLLGRFGPRAAQSATSLVSRGLAHMVASDAHRAANARGLVGPAVELLGDATLARWLTVDVPGAIVAGGSLPARPSPARSVRGGSPRALDSLRSRWFTRRNDH